MTDRTVAVRLRAKVDQYQADLRKASTATSAFGASAQKSLKGVTKSAAQLGDGYRIGAGIALAAMGAFAVKSIAAASDLNETVSKTGVLFGQSAGKIEAWASTASTSLGQSKKQAMDAAASFAVFGKSAGLSGDALVEFSQQNVQLASDMASFFNTSPEDAITAIGSAFRGEAEPIRAYGVLLDDASMRQQALEMGIISSTKNALTPQQKVLAAQSLIMKQTADAQGDFARTSDGLANSQRILAAQFEDTQAQLGQALLPVALKATQVMGGLLKVVNGLPTPLKMVGIGLAASAAGFILLAPRIVATVEAYKALTASGTAAGVMAGRLGKAFMVAAPYLAVAAAIGVIAAGTKSANDELSDMLKQGEELDRLFRAASKPGRMQELADEAAALRDRINEAANSGGFTQLALGWNALWADFFDEVDGDPIGEIGESMAHAAQDAGVAADAFGSAAYAVGLIVTPARLAQLAVEGVTAATKAWKGIASTGEAEDKLAAGFDALSEAVKANKGTLDGTTEAARNARGAFRSSMGDIAAYAETLKSPQAKAEALRSKLGEMREKLAAMGLSSSEIARLVKPYEQLAAKAAAAAAQQRNIERNIQITLTYTSRGKVPNADGKPLPVNANGGPIRGPGTGTSDSIVSRLSNGEFVVKAASVDKYGVDFLHAVNDGRLESFASGGRAGRRGRRTKPKPLTPAQERARARKDAAIDRVRTLKDAKQSESESVAGSMRTAFGLMGAFDFGAQARAIDDLAAANERLAAASRGVADADGAVFEARRAVNSAGTPQERAEAEKKLADALAAQTKARSDQATAETDVAAAKKAVTKTAHTRENILDAWKGKLEALQKFNQNLKALRKAGFSPSIVAQIASDPDGAEIAAVLAKASPSQVARFNSYDAQIADLSGQIGATAAGALYNDKIKDAQKKALQLGATIGQVGPVMSTIQAQAQTSSRPIQVQLQVGRSELASVLVDVDRRFGGVDGR